MKDNKILVIHSRGVYNFMAKFGVITMFHCSVIMHCFKKKNSDLGTFFQLCTNKIPIEFALGDEHKDLHS